MPRPSTGLNTASRKLPDGSTEYRWYHRATGLLIGSNTTGWTKEAAIERAKDLDGGSKSGPPAGSFGELCTLYLSSPGFKALAPKTRKGYRTHIELLRGMWETVPLPGINRKAVRAVHALYEDRPWQGNAIIRTLRLVMNFGLDDLELPGILKNPAQRTTMYETASRTQVWDDVRIEAFLAHAEPRLRLAFALLLYTVQRPSDVLTMARPMIFQRDGRDWIRLRQAKTGEPVDVPCHQVLTREMAMAAKAAAAAVKLADQRRGEGVHRVRASDLLVASPTGKPWAYRNFARSWDAARRRTNWTLMRAALAAAGGLPPPRQGKARADAKAAIRLRLLGDLQRRDLRRTGVVQLALAGATVPQIAALAGWRIDYTQSIVDTYLPQRGDVALAGMERWEKKESGQVVSLVRAPRRAGA